jgi:hypothetical protein
VIYQESQAVLYDANRESKKSYKGRLQNLPQCKEVKTKYSSELTLSGAEFLRSGARELRLTQRDLLESFARLLK